MQVLKQALGGCLAARLHVSSRVRALKRAPTVRKHKAASGLSWETATLAKMALQLSKECVAREAVLEDSHPPGPMSYRELEHDTNPSGSPGVQRASCRSGAPCMHSWL